VASAAMAAAAAMMATVAAAAAAAAATEPPTALRARVLPRVQRRRGLLCRHHRTRRCGTSRNLRAHSDKLRGRSEGGRERGREAGRQARGEGERERGGRQVGRLAATTAGGGATYLGPGTCRPTCRERRQVGRSSETAWQRGAHWPTCGPDPAHPSRVTTRVPSTCSGPSRTPSPRCPGAQAASEADTRTRAGPTRPAHKRREGGRVGESIQGNTGGREAAREGWQPT
jgi:hypothetical protein